MAEKVVILGGGTGGTLLANRLRRQRAEKELEISVVDRDDVHVYQPGLLFVPFGLTHAEDITRFRRRQLRSGVAFHETEVDHVDLERERVHLSDGTVLPYIHHGIGV